MADPYDVIVVGAGGMGSAALWQLARRGARVLGLERGDIGQARGSSQGVTRIIRLAYFEHPSYVPLLRRAYALWREAEAISGERLLYVTGGLDIGAPDSRVIQGSLQSCREHDLPHELLDPEAVQARYPAYRIPTGSVAVYQPDGGFVASERAILVHLRLALEAGAELHGREAVLRVEPVDGGVEIVTTKDRYRARRAIVSAGAWVDDLVPELRGKATPELQVLGWFQPRKPDHFALGRFPISVAATEHGYFYQFPVFEQPGFKIGLFHHLREQGPADRILREPNAADEDLLRRGIRLLFPDADGPVLRLSACLFTNLADEHFLIDHLPGHEAIIVASPCSGHGFKFASVIGEVLAELALTGETGQTISLFRFDRLAG